MKLSGLMLIAALAVAAQPATAPNLLRNGGFDRDTSGWRLSYGSGWTSDADRGGGVAKVVNPGDIRSRGYEGLTALTTGISQCVRVRADREYSLLVRARVPMRQPVAGYATAEILWFETKNCAIRSDGSGIIDHPASAKLVELDGAWHDLALSALAPPAHAAAVEVALLSAVTDFTHRGDFEVWFDDARLFDASRGRPR